MSVMPLLHHVQYKCVAIKRLFHLSFFLFKRNCSQFCIRLVQIGADASETLYALSRICEDRLLAPMRLSVCSPVWNKSTSLGFFEILYCGGDGGGY